ncbi:hypothetical protein DYB37_000905 [Aphanomyces astaci]|uniref:Cyclic nucleotide-binding domain-containing protein n=1 Tax=Aphanomyces astaci TaxID=112090 RepID=A0A418EGP8_APHAT|nr:hypothetical protein DYB35_002221 [Aphanomyces astaci]RHZ12500.1 hypothetical protein DYB37_000905 [Aphanomyces astaci]
MIYNLIQIPFRIALLPAPPDKVMLGFTIVDIACDVIFLVDMYIKYNHLIIIDKNGDEVVSLALIRSNYVHGQPFKIEACASLPLYYVGNYQVMTLCRLPRLLRSSQLSKYLRSFHTFVQEQTASAAVTEGLEFVKLFLTLVLASHLAAMGLFLISHAEHGDQHGDGASDVTDDVPSWYSHDFVIEQFHGSIGATYLRAFYWGLGLSSFDYMDIHVSKAGETLWFCVVALSGVVFIGVIIGQVCTAIFNANKVEMQLQNFAFYAKMKKLPGFMVRRAKLFFQFQLDCNKGMDAHEIFRDLPQCLRLELFKDLYANLLAPIPIFSMLSPAQLNAVAERLHSKLYLPGDDIIMEGDVGNALYIMKQGLGEKHLRTFQLIVAPVYEGSSFGEVAFFLAKRHSHGVRAVKCCEVLCLTKADWTSAWSSEVSLNFKVKMAMAVEKEDQLMERITTALKGNFGVTGQASIKLTSMLGVKKRASLSDKHTIAGRRDSVPNYFEYIREVSRSGARKGPLLSQFAPTPRATIWHPGPPQQPSWMPHSLFRNVWDVIMLAVTTYYVTMVPFRASFVEFPQPAPYWIVIWFAAEYVLDVLSVADFVLRFQVFYVFAKGEMQTLPAVLRRHYRVHGPLISDIVALVPVEIFAIGLFSHTNSWKLVSLCRLNRILRLVHLPRLTHSLEHVLSRRKWFMANRTAFEYMMTFVAPFFIVCHWIACLWFYVSFASRSHGDTPSWLVTMGYLPLNMTMASTDDIPLGFSESTKFTSMNVYLASLYYAVSSLSSQSFGDVFSRNAVETWLTLGIILFSITFYGVLVGMLAEMMQDKLHPRASFEQHMVDVSTFFNYRLLPFDFFIQTSRFSRLQWQNHMGRTEDDFLSVLSTTIREDIAMFVKQNVVKNLRFLLECEEVFVRALVTKLRTEQFIHADVIYQFGDVGRTLYFVDVGSVSLVSATTGVQTRNHNEFFGGVALFEDVGRTVTAIANVECTMFLLYHDDFDKLVDRFPEYFDRCYKQWCVRDEDPIQKMRGSSAGFNHLKLTPDGVVTGSSDHLQKSPILLVAPAPPAATIPAPLMHIPVHTRPTPPSSFGPVKTQLTTAAVTGPNSRQRIHPKLIILVILIAIHPVVDRCISQELKLVLEALQLLYIGFSVPFCFGLLYDPLGTATTVSTLSTYLTYGLDLVEVAMAFIIRSPMDMKFLSDTDRRNSAFMNKLIKLSSWDKKRVIETVHVVLDWVALVPFHFFWLANPHAMILSRFPKLLRMHKGSKSLVKHMLADHQLFAGFHNIGMSLLVGVILLTLVLIHWAATFVLSAMCLALSNVCIHHGIGGVWFPVPQMNLERFIVNGIHFPCGRALRGESSGAYFFLFACQNRHTNEFHDQVDGGKENLTARRFSKHIQSKVLDFWSAERGIDEDTILATLPSHIQTQCYHSLRVKLLKNVSLCPSRWKRC